MIKRTKRRAQIMRQTCLAQLDSLPAIDPATVRQITQAEADKPMRGQNKELDAFGLFGDSHQQSELFNRSTNP